MCCPGTACVRATPTTSRSSSTTRWWTLRWRCPSTRPRRPSSRSSPTPPTATGAWISASATATATAPQPRRRDHRCRRPTSTAPRACPSSPGGSSWKARCRPGSRARATPVALALHAALRRRRRLRLHDAGPSTSPAGGAGQTLAPYVVPNPYLASAELRARALRRLRTRRAAPRVPRPAGPAAQSASTTCCGELVQTLQHDGSNDGFVAWDLRTKDNLDVAPGLYIFHVDGGRCRHEHRQVRDRQMSARSDMRKDCAGTADPRLRPGRRVGPCPEQGRLDHRHVPADRTRRPRRRLGQRRGRRCPAASRRCTTTPAPSACWTRPPCVYSHANWFADISHDYVALAPAGRRPGQPVRQRDRPQFRRDRRAHRRRAPGHGRALHGLATWPWAWATAGASPAASPPASRSTTSPRRSGTRPTTALTFNLGTMLPAERARCAAWASA